MQQDHTYKIIEAVGSSSSNIEDAVKTAIKRSAKNVHDMKWFEVSEIRGWIDGSDVGHWQVRVKIGFTLDE